MRDDNRMAGRAGRGFRKGILVCTAAGLSLLAILLPPIHDLQGYHAFADQRSAFGLRHFWNTVTNAGFIAAGLYGAVVTARRRTAGLQAEHWAFLTVFVGSVLVGLGSAYYHQEPNDSSLFWDRLPMTVVFTGVLVAAIAERVSARAAAALLVPLLAVGVLSVEIWQRGAGAGSGDLRLYALVQYGSTLVLVLILILFPGRQAGGRAWWWALGCYGAAKVFELSDGMIWELSRRLTGGHALKHAAAACAMVVLAEMVRRRPRTAAGRPATASS
jgi:hypothetical protein